jgi:hypothetical protein
VSRRDEGLGAGPGQSGEHRTPADTRRITEERLRSVGYDKTTARREAEKVARDVHESKR